MHKESVRTLSHSLLESASPLITTHHGNSLSSEINKEEI